MSTRLVQVCDITNKLIIKKVDLYNVITPMKHSKYKTPEIINIRYSEISSLALKDLNEKHWEKPGQFTSELQNFENYVMDEAIISA